ncbi:MAG: hypothetical protein R3301_18545 [Saprospiraceae bacterium]|nr:hypothetical protein [Saprospiraceae bacterium]
MQVTHTCTQINDAPPPEVFPLLCPVREADWLEDWQYEMIHSESGIVEQGCVFTTPHHGTHPTTWYTVLHDPAQWQVQFVRVTPGEMVVHIAVHLEAFGTNQTRAHIAYTYTPLNDAQTSYVHHQLPEDFRNSMTWWETALNHYLQTGTMLRKSRP